MKKLLMMMVMTIAIATSASAMSYEQARREALFLADKMAYELDLSDEQYEAAYEINLDYLKRVNDRRHLFGTYWSTRNTLFRTVLAPWQFKIYVGADYFYRPLYWSSNAWRWRIYNRYDRERFYRRHPSAYISYRGGRHLNYYQRRSWYSDNHRMRHRRDDMYLPTPTPRRHIYEGRDRDYRRYDRDQRRYDRRERREYQRYEQQRMRDLDKFGRKEEHRRWKEHRRHMRYDD